MTNPYFEQVEKNIQTLISEKKFQKAYSFCVEFLNKYPGEKNIIKLKENIEKIVSEENGKIIKTKLQEIEPLWEKEDYVKILTVLKKLLSLSPNNEKVKNSIIKAQEKYKEKTEKLQKEFENSQIKRLNEILEKNPDMIIDDLLALEMNNPGNAEVQKISKEYRTKLIEKKIKEKDDLIYSDKYDSIYNFINQLKKIDGKNEKILELEKFIKIRQHGSQVSEKKEFIYKSKNNLLTLMRLKKYDKVIKVAEEILGIDINDEKVKKILEDAKGKFFNQTKIQVAEKIKNEYPILVEDYKKDKNKFIKI